jgi:hypothetical protein
LKSAVARRKKMPQLNIKPLALFHTPKSLADLEKHISQYSGPERAVAAVAMGMTWNYLAGVVAEYQQALDKERLQNPYAHIDPDKE